MGRANDFAIVAMLAILVLAILSPVVVYAARLDDVALLATIGLLALPVMIILLVVILLAIQRPAHAAAEPKLPPAQKYSWERLFAPRKAEKVKGVNDKLLLVAVLLIALVLLVILGPALRKIIGPGLSQSSGQPAITAGAAQEAQGIPAAKAEKQAEGKNATAPLNLSGIGTALKQNFLKIPRSAFRYAAIGLVVLLLVGAAAYSYRAVDVSHTDEWFIDWLSAIRDNAVKLAALAVIVAALAAAITFRERLRLPALFGSVASFLALYRLYIAIGVAVLLAIIGVLVVLERKGSRKAAKSS